MAPQKIITSPVLVSHGLKNIIWAYITIHFRPQNPESRFIRLVIYCQNLMSELKLKLLIEFCLVMLLVRSRNRGIKCGSNPRSDRVPTVDDQPY